MQVGKLLSSNVKTTFTGQLQNKADILYPGLRTRIDNALRNVGNKYLLEPYKGMWTPERPETGYCHAVTEVLLRAKSGVEPPIPEGSVAWRIATKEGSHYCIKTPNGDILDFTSNQAFEELPDYDKGQPKKIVETAERYESFLNDNIVARISVLAEKLGIDLKPLPSLKKVIQSNVNELE